LKDVGEWHHKEGMSENGKQSKRPKVESRVKGGAQPKTYLRGGVSSSVEHAKRRPIKTSRIKAGKRAGADQKGGLEEGVSGTAPAEAVRPLSQGIARGLSHERRSCGR